MNNLPCERLFVSISLQLNITFPSPDRLHAGAVPVLLDENGTFHVGISCELISLLSGFWRVLTGRMSWTETQVSTWILKNPSTSAWQNAGSNVKVKMGLHCHSSLLLRKSPGQSLITISKDVHLSLFMASL